MENQAKTIVTEFLKAVQTGNNAQLAALLSPNIRWEQPGDNLVSGIKNSAAEVFGMVGKMFELSANSLRLTDIKSVTVNGNEVACLLQWQATKPDGATLNVENIDVYTVNNGEIVKARVFTADIEAENSFWS
ncbi:nuclear transport factor 2 family protein [Longitalea luteola]|uniref:nuclear transport factor 2 family protein n=1 Tax=Longitalea luteola TaxID=2812563 RepID=UPI001A96BCB9|nr:nuclear transport factor 2 family protein [Longitalea luteola]